MNRVARFFRLSTGDKALLIQAILLLAAIRVGLRALSFAQLRRLLARICRQRDIANERLTVEARDGIVWAVETASRHFPAIGTCLTQALALHVLLARHGWASNLRIGVARDGEGRFVAHAWLEHDGTILVGQAGHESYTPLPALHGLEP